jgi:Flp pilus assembly pilin Flp
MFYAFIFSMKQLVIFIKDEAGTVAVDYTVLISGIAIVIYAAVSLFGQQVLSLLRTFLVALYYSF